MWCDWPESNRHGNIPADFKSAAATDYATVALKWSEYKDSNLGPSGPKPDALARLRYTPMIGGGDRTRTRYPLLAKQMLSQLSYTPKILDRLLITLYSACQGEFGAPCPTRTDHLLITNQLLYQMS
jgi:hypothetical protein